MMKRLCLVILAVLALAAAAVAEEPMMMKPDPMLRQLDWFAGTWGCTGVAYASPMAPEHATKATVTASWGFGGYWLPFTYSETKTAQNPMPVMFGGYFGYDAQEKKLVLGAVDNMGGYTTGSSSGWSGDSLVFTGPWHMTGGVGTSRDTFTKKSANEMVHLGEIEMNGTWSKLGRETCTRKK